MRKRSSVKAGRASGVDGWRGSEGGRQHEGRRRAWRTKETHRRPRRGEQALQVADPVAQDGEQVAEVDDAEARVELLHRLLEPDAVLGLLGVVIHAVVGDRALEQRLGRLRSRVRHEAVAERVEQVRLRVVRVVFADELDEDGDDRDKRRRVRRLNVGLLVVRRGLGGRGCVGVRRGRR